MWVNPQGNASFTNVMLNELSANSTPFANELAFGTTASGVVLTPNTPYTIKATLVGLKNQVSTPPHSDLARKPPLPPQKSSSPIFG